MTPVPTFDCAAILFDLDGVLVDSAECVERTWRHWAETHGLDPTAVIRAAHGRRTIETLRVVAPQLDSAAEAAQLAACESTETDGVYEVPGARSLLASLAPNAWAVVTSGIRAVAELRMRHTRLPYPAVLVCADEVAHGKPNPEGYLTAARRLGAAPERCLVVEDAPPGIEAARAAGMRAIGILGTYEREALSQADAVVPSLGWLHITGRKAGVRVEVRPPDAKAH
ncbi:MAG TPA: HAD-IA family hydrolase [Gemmatimonadaceae bacterium]|nr:HAD-IA family hydrolase [Gemmatimonadaceae bacterium]